MANIYQYIDYHQWLSAAFAARKAQSPSFSHRMICSRLGLKSSGYILYVMQGKRTLTDTMALKLARFFRLSNRESDYLLQMIRYCHARSANEKQFQFERLVGMRKKQVKDISPDQYRFYEKWYNPVIRETIGIRSFSGDYDALATMLVPQIRASEARDAIELLVELQLIDRDENGIYHKKNSVISTGESWQSTVIHAHQRSLLTLGRDALDTIPKSDRDLSHLTITASAETLVKIKESIARLRAEILEMARAERHADRVLLCNFMVFPAAVSPEKQQ